MARKIILIDGNSLVYRAFFALPTTLATSSGQVTNAVYGFTSMLLKLLKDEKPDALAVAFDSGPSFRKEHFAEYKAHRPKTPDELSSQFPLVRELLRVLRIPIYELPGYEADDILASTAKRLSGPDSSVIIVTGDKDAFQLISDGIRVMTTKKGISDIVVYDREKVIERYGVPPERFVDFLALKGDSSDNIPGVPGVGDKTASKLIQEFGSVDDMLERIDEIEGERLKKNIEEHVAEARLSKMLATLESDLPVEVDLEEMTVGGWEEGEVRSLFSLLEFSTLLERFLAGRPAAGVEAEVEAGVEAGVAAEEKVVPLLPADIKSFAERLSKVERYALYPAIEGFSIDRRITALAFVIPNEPSVYIMEIPEGGGRREVFASLKDELESNRPRKVVYDYKAAVLAFYNEDIELNGAAADPMLAAYLHYPDRASYPIEELVSYYLRRALPEEVMGSGLAARARAVLDLADAIAAVLDERETSKLYVEVEIPLARVLAKMEREGVGLDAAHFERLSKEMDLMLERIESEIFALAGEEFNVASSQQLGRILFEKLGLPAERKTKTGYSTDIRVLSKLVDAHPIVEKVITFRELAKLKSTYVDALPRMINPRTGRLHTNFNQTGTSTGRLSSHDPNLQNIPIRTEAGLRIREGFVPAREGDRFLAADYSQIELRLLAHFSEDELLIKAYEEGEDIHSATAQRVFGALPEQVTSQMRRIAKMINFGVLYGMSAFGLADRLNISQSQAKEYIERYFARYPGVKRFVDEAIRLGQKRGYTNTILGRRRPVPELVGGDRRLRGLGERLAVNAPLQGSAADIIKMAMIHLDHELGKRNLKARMILQVHDELILELPAEEIDAASDLVREVMEGVFSLRAPLKVDVSSGSSWKDTK